MAKQLQLRKGTATEHNTFTGANGEVTVDTTNKTLRLHDGITVGGKIVDDPTRDVTSQVSASTETTAGKAKIATTAIAQAGTNDTDIITAKKLRDALNAEGGAFGFTLRGMVSVAGNGDVLSSKGAISSVTKTGVGTCLVNITNPLGLQLYPLVSSLSNSQWFGVACELVNNQQIRVFTRNTNNGVFIDLPFVLGVNF